MRVKIEHFFMSRKIFRTALYGFILCAISILLMSCGLNVVQKRGVSSFGNAALDLGDTVSEQLPTMRNNVIEMKKLRYAIENEELPALKDRKSYQDKFNFDSGLDPDNLNERIKAVNLLSSYGSFLIAFSRETQEKELKAASNKLVESIQDFPDTSLSDDQVKGLGKVVQVSGKLFIEWKKKKAIQKIVPKVSPLIQQLCDSLEKDFNKKKTGIAHNVDIVQDRLYNESIDGLKRGSTSVSDRLVQLEGFMLADDSLARLERTSERVLKAVSSMRKADKEIVQLVKNKSVSIEDIKLFHKNTKELVDALKVFVK